MPASIGVANSSSNNSALVTGTGSLWTNRGSMTVGGEGSGNRLTVADGGTLAASNIVIADSNSSSGTVNIGRFGTNDAGGTINTASIAFGSGTGVLNFNQSNSAAISAAISGDGSVNQLGSGSTTLSASNSYTGGTTVSGGQLVVDGSINNSTVTVNSSGTLAGSGSVGGLIVTAGGTISPGNSPGNLTLAGNLVWNGGGNYNWQVLGTTNTSGATAGTTWDLITVTGALDLGALTTSSKFNINLWSLAPTNPDTNGNIANFNPATSYKWLAVAAGTISGFNADNFNVNYLAANGTGGFSNPLDPGATFGVSQEGNNLYVTYGQAAPIPEPGTWAAMAIFAGGAAYAGWRRRRAESLDQAA
jgi:T5SS/PEP-CTERM-associated repeat protein/autotransporter-associated beta strand protein